MSITSLTFLIYFTVVFLLYYFLGKGKATLQNWILLLASYVFYGIANWKMIPLMFVTTLLFFYLGIAIGKTVGTKKAHLFTAGGVILGVGVLLYFKYLNFFIESFASLFTELGLQVNINTFKIILPLGISYFTFKMISYVIELNRGKIVACKNFVAFSTYISFFPTIIAGPIDRPNVFIPQLYKTRIFNYNLVVDGCRQILWGLFTKMVIADNLVIVINNVWSDIPAQSGSALLIAAFFLSIQFYTDFSGYSNMAIGLGKTLGLRVNRNFQYPFFSTNMAEFWRRWHISLTSWCTDYVFMPLNVKFRNWGKLGVILAVIINMIVVGLWHGANWTYGVFGFYQGLLFIPLVYSGTFLKKRTLKINRWGFPLFMDFLGMIKVFLLFTFGTLIFQANSLSQASEYLNGIFNPSILSISGLYGTGMKNVIPIIPLFILMFFFEWSQRENEYPLQILQGNKIFFMKNTVLTRWFIYIVMICVITLFVTPTTNFLYAQF